MKSVALFLTGLLVGACTQAATVPPTSPSFSHVESAQDLTSKTVALVGLTETGVRPYCTGVWVSPTAILTAFHCIDDIEGNSALFSTRDDVYAFGTPNLSVLTTVRQAAIFARDPAHDLALLQGYAPTHGIAHTYEGPIMPGMFAQAMGHSSGLWWSYSDGVIAAVRQLDVNGLDLVWVQSTA